MIPKKCPNCNGDLRYEQELGRYVCGTCRMFMEFTLLELLDNNKDDDQRRTPKFQKAGARLDDTRLCQRLHSSLD